MYGRTKLYTLNAGHKNITQVTQIGLFSAGHHGDMDTANTAIYLVHTVYGALDTVPLVQLEICSGHVVSGGPLDTYPAIVLSCK